MRYVDTSVLIAYRRAQLGTRDEGKRRDEYLASDAVLRRLEHMLADAKSRTLV